MRSCGNCMKGAPYDGPWRAGEQCVLCWYCARKAVYCDDVPPPPPAEPGLLAKAAHYVVSAAVHVATGMKEVEPDERERRHAICVTNRCGVYSAGDDRCLACGCALHDSFLGNKTRWASEKCPKGFW